MTEKTTTDAANTSASSGTGDASKTDATKTGTDTAKSGDTTSTTKGADSALGAAAGDEKGSDEKKGEGDKKADAKPIELKLPEGMKADDAKVVAAKKLAGELGLDSEKAQKLFEADLAQSAAAETAFAEQDKKWAETWRADPELGGKHTDATIKDIRKAFTHFKADEARQLLLAAGLGNHPTIVKTFASIGRALRDDRIAGTANGAAGSSKPKSDGELFYGKPPTTDTAAS